jgi:hypothetical protein
VRRGLLLVLIVACGGLVLTASAASRLLSNSGDAPPDAVGDSGTAPDLTTLSMENDDTGKLTWKIGLGNRTAWAPPDYIQIPIDADGLDSTGPNGGFEFAIEAHTQNGTRLFHFSGLDYERVDSKTLTSSFADGVLSISIDFRELGTQFPRFFLYSDTFPPESDNFWDEAPAPPQSYLFQAVVPLLLDSFKPPKSARAGAALPVSVSVWTDDQASPTISCKARAGRKTVTGKSSWAAISIISSEGRDVARKGVAGCRFAVTRALRGKTLAVTLTLTKEGVTLKQSFTKKIR